MTNLEFRILIISETNLVIHSSICFSCLAVFLQSFPRQANVWVCKVVFCAIKDSKYDMKI